MSSLRGISDTPAEQYGGFAYVYDSLMADMPYGEWLGWLEAYWSANGRPGTVADLGCGTGTIVLPLAQSGINVTGVDLSEHMIAVARRKEAAARSELSIPGTIRWIKADMREWRSQEPLECVVSLCDALNYLASEDDVLKAFRCAYESLADGGVFLFDMHHLNHFDELTANEPFCLDGDDVSYIWTCSMQGTAAIRHRLVLFVRDGERYERIVENHTQVVYTEETVKRLLVAAGFTEVESFADFSFEPIDDASTERMFFAAVR